MNQDLVTVIPTSIALCSKLSRISLRLVMLCNLASTSNPPSLTLYSKFDRQGGLQAQPCKIICGEDLLACNGALHYLIVPLSFTCTY